MLTYMHYSLFIHNMLSSNPRPSTKRWLVEVRRPAAQAGIEPSTIEFRAEFIVNRRRNQLNHAAVVAAAAAAAAAIVVSVLVTADKALGDVIFTNNRRDSATKEA